MPWKYLSEGEGGGMGGQVRHLRLDVEHPVYGRKTHFISEGTLTVGRYPSGEATKPDIPITDTENVVSRNHGEIRRDKDGRVWYKDHSKNGTDLYGRDGFLRKINNEEIEIKDLSWVLRLPNDSVISFVGRVEVKVSGPQQIKAPAQLKENKLDEILDMAGNRNAAIVNKFIDTISERRDEEIEAGKLGMGVDNNGHRFKGGMWVEGSLAHLPKDGKAIIVGDIHSRLNCLKDILRETNFVERVRSGEKVYLVFMGDFADRPNFLGDMGGIKVLETVLHLKSQFWNNVVVLSGNHDIAREGEIHPQQFPEEARMKYGEDQGNIIFEKYRLLFEKMPIALKIDNGVFVTHGGAANTVRRLADVINPSEETKSQMHWNDPDPQVRGYEPSLRGIGIQYGKKVHDEFLKAVGSKVLVRAHQQDIRSDFNDTSLTLNSTDYKNALKAYATIDLSQEIHNTKEIEIHRF